MSLRQALQKMYEISTRVLYYYYKTLKTCTRLSSPAASAYTQA